jgi:hypothetical protein
VVVETRKMTNGEKIACAFASGFCFGMVYVIVLLAWSNLR